VLPTIDQCGSNAYVDGEQFYAVQHGLDRFYENTFYVNLFSKIRILPILSDPTSEDGDGDTLLDINDNHPLIEDWTNYFIVYDNPGADFIEQAEWMATYAYYGNNVEYIYVTTVNEFVDAWNSMDMPIYTIHLYIHGGVDYKKNIAELYFYNEQMFYEDFNKLNNKTVQNKVYLYSCEGGTQIGETSMAWEFSKLISGKPVVALVNDKVDYFNWKHLTQKFPIRHGKTGYWAEVYSEYIDNKWVLTLNKIGDNWRL
jgi:hypothetical protein